MHCSLMDLLYIRGGESCCNRHIIMRGWDRRNVILRYTGYGVGKKLDFSVL